MILRKLHSVITAELGVLLLFIITYLKFTSINYDRYFDYSFSNIIIIIFGIVQISLFLFILVRLILLKIECNGFITTQIAFQWLMVVVIVLIPIFSIVYIILSLLWWYYVYKIYYLDKRVSNKIFNGDGNLLKHLKVKDRKIIKYFTIFNYIVFLILYIYSSKFITIDESGSFISNGFKFSGPIGFMTFSIWGLGLLTVKYKDDYYKSNTLLWLVFNVLSIAFIVAILLV